MLELTVGNGYHVTIVTKNIISTYGTGYLCMHDSKATKQCGTKQKLCSECRICALLSSNIVIVVYTCSSLVPEYTQG